MIPFSLPPRPPEGPGSAQLRLRKRQAFGLLDQIGQQLEPTPTQLERAETAYTTIGEWLSDDEKLAASAIYLQGSVAHGTANKPIGRNEHDVDLICHVPGYGMGLPPATLKKMVGDRLAAHDRYRPILKEMPRCWRLNYAGDFHLDITPSIPNPACGNGGELVPDRTLREWKPSNPKGFRDLFARRASLRPRMRAMAADGRIAADANIEPFPEVSPVKGVLRRTVQLTKRHRDVAFQDADPALIPLSIIITTLASKAYEWCVRNETYDNELDLMCDTVRAMPWFLDHTIIEGRKFWLVMNETTSGENFAEKWNTDRRRAEAFFGWHAQAVRDFDAIAAAEGLDEVGRDLSKNFGSDPVVQAMKSRMDEVGEARRASRLVVAPTLGLTAASVAGTAVRANTFYGR
jgi:hypothetical protein